jgi:hypothetical protein
MLWDLGGPKNVPWDEVCMIDFNVRCLPRVMNLRRHCIHHSFHNCSIKINHYIEINVTQLSEGRSTNFQPQTYGISGPGTFLDHA